MPCLKHLEKSSLRRREYFFIHQTRVHYVRRYYAGWETYESCSDGHIYVNGRNLAALDQQIDRIKNKGLATA